MQPQFIASHPALDFLNTSYTPEGSTVEVIGDGRALLDWLVAAQFIDTATSSKLARKLGTRELDEAAAEARRMREWARTWLVRWRERPADDYRSEIQSLNRLLAGGAFRHEVARQESELRLVERPQLDSADALVALLAMQVAALVTQEEPGLVKSCAGQQCSLWFLDRTKAHRRIFCSASACGNRAKVAAFRQRQKG